jgi:hypothetical protein
MTLKELALLDKDFLAPNDVAQVLGCKPYSINVQAKKDPVALGFPVTVIGSRVKIPRIAFLHWMRFGCTPIAPAVKAPTIKENSK